MHKHYVAILLIISGLASSQDCKYSLSGKVTDLHDGSLLSGATLVFNEINKTAQTDLDGRYDISNLCKRQYSIKLIHPSCESITFKININGNTNRDFKLEHHIEELNEIIVKGNPYDDQSKSVYENKVSTETLEQYSTGSLGDALNSLSGISSLNKGNGIVKPIINGLHRAVSS